MSLFKAFERSMAIVAIELLSVSDPPSSSVTQEVYLTSQIVISGAFILTFKLVQYKEWAHIRKDPLD